MNKHRVHIENINIRIPHSSAGQARAIASGLGREILQSIAISTSKMRGKKKIDELSTGKISVTGGANTPGLQKQIADRVVEELRKRFE